MMSGDEIAVSLTPMDWLVVGIAVTVHAMNGMCDPYAAMRIVNRVKVANETDSQPDGKPDTGGMET